MSQRPCACDGRTYDNACDAHMAGTDFSLADDSACDGVFRCGWFSCNRMEACLTSSGDDLPTPSRCVYPGEEFPFPEECDVHAVSCACFVLDGTSCTCSEPAPGEVRITCDGSSS